MEHYKSYMENALKGLDFSVFNRRPKKRYHTIKYCFDYLNVLYQNGIVPEIAELGTSRSFVDGDYEGCNKDDIKYWEPNNPNVWDWGAGAFTILVVRCLDFPKNFYSVDLNNSHINRSKVMTSGYDVKYFNSSSEDFLQTFDKQFDLLYMDTGDMTPIEDTAQLHLREAKIIVNKNLIKKGGLILIDDIMSPVPFLQGEKSKYGKGKYSIPYLLDNGFEIVMEEYQYILRKI